MRKLKVVISFIFILISTLLISFNVSAGASFKYVWNNTTIVIPVGSSFSDYRNLPVATLYRDGVALADANITYNTEGDWLYYAKNVDTNKTGTYYVWYKAYDNVYIPGTCTDYKCKIAFIVKDLIPPTISPINEEVFVVKNSEYDLASNISASDNYTLEPTITFSHNIDYGKVGSYEVLAIAKDEEGNYAKTNFNVVVYDDAKYPVITCNAIGGDITVPLGDSSFDIKQYFKATDYKDGDITEDIYYPSYDNSTLGDYEYIVNVTNSAGLTTEYSVILHVKDEEAPYLELTTHSIFMDYRTDFENYNYNQYIKSLTDNLAINYDNLYINYTMENKIGSYIISYSYTDGIYTVSDTINVSLVSYQSPKITVSDINIKEDSNVDLSQFITIVDESDDNIYESLEIDDSKVNYSEEGTYYATAFAMNSSGLSSTVKFRIIITSDSLFSKANIGISITAIILFVIVIGLSGLIGTYLILKKRKKI